MCIYIYNNPQQTWDSTIRKGESTILHQQDLTMKTGHVAMTNMTKGDSTFRNACVAAKTNMEA